MKFKFVFGVDFSGAKLAGRNTWVARLTIGRGGRLRVAELSSLEKLSGSAEREAALGHLVRAVADSRDALWGMDFPFGLPIEVLEPGWGWAEQLKWVGTFAAGAYPLGEECVRRARGLGGAIHIRRATDAEVQTPFDCYHYRIIYQTFHGMRDVLLPLAGVRGTAILPFQYSRLARARRVVVESCPSSTLKRLGLPHQNYKQPQGGALSAKRLRVRRRIVEGIGQHVDIPPTHRRTMMRNPGGDALDAVIAAVGAAQGWASADHRSIRRHPRYALEGRLYC